MRLTVSAQYMDNPLCGFYGFNGAASPYYSELNLRKSADKKDGIAFYADYQRQLLFSVDLQGRLASNLTWIGGLKYSWQKYSDVSFSPYDGTETLFHQYVESGLIPQEDTFGHRPDLKFGSTTTIYGSGVWKLSRIQLSYEPENVAVIHTAREWIGLGALLFGVQ